MHNNVLNVSRSIQTIRDCTSVVASIPLRNSIDELQIRVLNLNQANKQLRFILTLKSETEGIKHSVKVFSEAILLHGKLRHLINMRLNADTFTGAPPFLALAPNYPDSCQPRKLPAASA